MDNDIICMTTAEQRMKSFPFTFHSPLRKTGLIFMLVSFLCPVSLKLYPPEPIHKSDAGYNVIVSCSQKYTCSQVISITCVLSFFFTLHPALSTHYPVLLLKNFSIEYLLIFHI